MHFALKDLTPGAQITGRTVGELGGWSTPVDMLTYTRDGNEYLLVANSGLPLMKIAMRDIEAQDELTQPRQPEGVAHTDLHHGVAQMAALGSDHILMLEVDDEGVTSLRTYDTASL